MRKTINTIFFIAFIAYAAVSFFPTIKSFLGLSRPLRVVVPKGTCAQTLAVFNFRSSGDPEAKYYAIGFARALADRIYCAPKHVTQQMTVNEIHNTISCAKRDPKDAVSDELAVKLGRKMGVSYVITGDFGLSKGKALIAVHVLEVARPSSKRTLTASGTLPSLPNMQSSLVPSVLSAMKIKPDAATSSELSQPNFTKPETLKVYAQSFLGKLGECEGLRWKAVQADPKASFPFMRLLDFYASAPLSCAQLRTNPKVAMAQTLAPTRCPGNSQAGIMHGLILARQSRYKLAEARLTQVANDDPDMIRTHTALGYVARLRLEGDLAVNEAVKASKAWPNNPYLHSSLAEAYQVAATNARHGHYSADMSSSVRNTWRNNCWNALTEAYIAVKLDPDCSEGWRVILDEGMQLGRDEDRNKAYHELIRIDPTDINAYTSYAFCFSPQWGGSDSDQQRIFAQAESAFPKGSYKPLVVRALSLSSNYPSSGRINSRYSQEITQLADTIYKMAGSECQDAALIKCEAYSLTRQRPEFLKAAEQGYNKWGGLNWQYHYGMGCAFAYEDRNDRAYLKKALALFSDYTEQVPMDAKAYVQWGWCLSHLGDRQAAKEKFLKALQIDPANESAKEKMKYVE